MECIVVLEGWWDLLVLHGYLVLTHKWQWPIYVPGSCVTIGWLFASCDRGGLQVHPHWWLYHYWIEVPCIVLLLVCGV